MGRVGVRFRVRKSLDWNSGWEKLGLGLYLGLWRVTVEFGEGLCRVRVGCWGWDELGLELELGSIIFGEN